MSKRLIPVLSLLAAVILLTTMNFTTPVGIGPLGVLIFFVAVYMLVFGVAFALVKIFTRVIGHKLSRKSYLYSAVIAFGPIMLLLAQSLGSVNAITVVLIVTFVILACFLISKRM